MFLHAKGAAAFFVISATVATVGCGGGEAEVPPAQVQTQTVQQANTPTVVTGCLKAGDAANTFVLTTAQTVDGTQAATYQLQGSAGVNLADHIGQRLEVSGVIRQQAEIATREPGQPAGEQATGTTGTPTVQTKTTLDIRQLDVTAVKSAGGECEM